MPFGLSSSVQLAMRQDFLNALLHALWNGGLLEGTATFDAEDPSKSAAQIVVKTASIDTHQADRDAHLRSDDFFAVETYPEIRFVSTAAKLVDAETWELSGDLTIKGVTKQVTVPFEFGGAAVDPDTISDVASQARWKPPMPLSATMSPVAISRAASAIGSSWSMGSPSAATAVSVGPQSGQAFGCA